MCARLRGMVLVNRMDDRGCAHEIECWFEANQRALPWRTDPRDPYRSLVSELMLQQTQVSRVLEKFGPFMDRFPTVFDLARAPEADVLGAWSGLGYYRRARLLHACAKAIVEEHGGEVPGEVSVLLKLPGIGRYTAGAIASIVFGERAAIVDGNVARVLLRLHNNDGDPGAASTQKWVWERAQALVDASGDPALCNEGLMELGALVCSPKSPGCDGCPVKGMCAAHEKGTTGSVPVPKARVKQTELYVAALLARDEEGRVWVEQRGESGLWARMWGPRCVEREDRGWSDSEAMEALGISDGDRGGLVETFTHTTTHRIVRFTVYRGDGVDLGGSGRWVTLEEARSMGLSSAHERVLSMGDTLFS